MGKRNLWVTLFGLIAVFSGVQAQEADLKGAFGYTFGEELSVDGRQLQYEFPTGMRIFGVERPPTPYQGLESYTVQVTPENRIYGITGAGALDSETECLAERDYIITVLSDRHVNMARLESQDPLIRRTVLRLQDQSVEILCIESDLSISYRDARVLRPIASTAPELRQSRPALQFDERDTSGL